MCYLIAKEFDKKGCIAVKTRHGKALADFTEKLQKQIGENGVQLVTISRPSAYGEYEPQEIMESKEKFLERVLSLQKGIMMEKPVLSPDFTIEDIHKLREYNYEMTKDMTDKERMDYYNSRGREVQKKLERMKAASVL